ncbi:MAG: acetylglutamate kinase [Ignavibacteriaceae bacterium]
MLNSTKSRNTGKIAIIKLSGKSINDFISSDKWVTAIKKLQDQYGGVIIVHGAGKTITEWAEKMGISSVFVEGHRVTTSDMMEIVSAVQGGLVNTKLSAKLNSSGIRALGLSGIDKNTFTAKYLDKNIGFVGRPEIKGSADWIKELLQKKVIPVFSSICCDEEGNLMNVNADLFTEVLAAALKAEIVFFVSDVNGVILDNEIKEYLTPDDIIAGINSNQITGGMIPKLKSCSGLLDQGVHKIWIGSDLISYLNGFSDHGTCIVKSHKVKRAKLKVA